MSDLADQGDALHAAAQGYIDETEFAGWAHSNWPAIAAALRERDDLRDEFDARLGLYRDELATALDQLTTALEHIAAERVRAETAEADADREHKGRKRAERYVGSLPLDLRQDFDRRVKDDDAAHAAAVEARHD